jgi:hypothetical protein
MKQGNQFWYGIKLKNKGEYLDISTISKVIFTFEDIDKIYDELSESVIYDYENNMFKIYLTQQDTQKLQGNVNIDVRVKFKNDEILGTSIHQKYIFDALNKEVI